MKTTKKTGVALMFFGCLAVPIVAIVTKQKVYDGIGADDGENMVAIVAALITAAIVTIPSIIVGTIALVFKK